MLIALVILSVVFSILSGFAKAICDLSEEANLFLFKKDNFFWHKSISWKNKWKLNNKGMPIKLDGKYVEKFWGSSRWFVFVTDAWHLFGLLERIGFIITWLSTGYLISQSLWYLFLLFNYIVFATSFHLFYNSKLLRYGNK